MEQWQIGAGALTIQQISQITGLSAHTLRYYERAGLMRQDVARDSTNGYRTYGPEHIGWLNFIKHLRSSGMPIRDIQRYTELLRQGERTLPERVQLLKQHRARVEQHLREQQGYLAIISEKIAHCEQLGVYDLGAAEAPQP